jgi:hypothetical protein
MGHMPQKTLSRGHIPHPKNKSQPTPSCHQQGSDNDHNINLPTNPLIRMIYMGLIIMAEPENNI